MKRLISILLTSVLLFALLAVPAFASNTPRFFLTGPSSAKAGDTVKISVNIEGSYSAHIVNLKVGFDPGSFDYVSYSYGNVGNAFTASGMAMCSKTADGKAVSYGALAASEAISAEGVIVELTFTVLGTAVSNPRFTITVEEFSYMPVGASNSNEISHTAEGLSMSVTGSSGGQGGGPTITPRPTEQGGAVNPLGTPEPAPTNNGSSRDNDNTPDPNRTQPAESGSPASASELPEVTEQAENTPEPGSNRGMSKSMKTVFFAIVGVLAAVLILVIVLLVLRSRKEKKR